MAKRNGMGTNLGNFYEERTMEVLEALGYYCLRSKRSQGPFDIVASNGAHSLFIQVKGSAVTTFTETDDMLQAPLPANTHRLLWQNTRDHIRVTELWSDGQWMPFSLGG